MRSLAGALLLAWAASAGAEDSPRPHVVEQVKTAFLFNFAKYVHWSDRGEARGLRFCVAGETRLGETLPLLEGRAVREETIEVHRLAAGAPTAGCRVLFVGEGDDKWRAALLAEASGGDTLTVSDRPRFVEAGGMIELFMEGERVRFAVNLDAVRASRLTVSSRLLRLARRLIERGEEGR